MKFRNKTKLKIITIFIFSILWISWDLSQIDKKDLPLYKSYKLSRDYHSKTYSDTKVAIVRSDDSALTGPVPITDPDIDYKTIEEMIRRAVELAGGFQSLIQPGHMVLLKPNIVDSEPPGSGEITDVRVIKALIKIINDIDPGKIEIVVGEGSPKPMPHEMIYQSLYPFPRWQKLWDASGYQDLLTDSYLDSINFRLSNLNGSPPDPWQDLVLVDVPGGGEALPQKGQYYIHKDILDADVFITVPVMKIHSTGITSALKNQIGIAPSTLYGFWKGFGVPQDQYRTRLIHEKEAPVYWTDKEIVDLSNIANIQFAVVDAIACLETSKSARRNGDIITNLVRMNTIIAGPDPVAVDHVCARLMGLNPDDVEHITLAEKIGLGTNQPDQIIVTGADLDKTKKRFKKNTSLMADFGQGNRDWLLNGPYPIEGISDPINHPFIADESSLSPEPSKNNWTEPVYFTDDRIDLKNYFNNPGSVVSYAFAYFDAPKDQEAELWIGSDEALKIYINGESVYNYNGTRTYSNDQFVSTKVKTNIKAGENRLLIKTLQKYGYYQFCLNICEPETNSNYDGDRIWGLKFKTESKTTSVKQQDINPVVNYKVYNAYPNPFNHTVQISFQISNPCHMHIHVHNLNGQKIRTLLQGQINHIGEKTLIWDGTDDNGNTVTSGLYLITFQGNNHTIISKKITLLK
jgi:uncharacterized protein (DUF362 family)